METNRHARSQGSGEHTAFSRELILPAILRNWYWFVVAAIVGLGLAMVFNKLFHVSYRSSMTLLLQNDPHQSPMNTSLDNLNIKEKTINIQDEQTVVSAYSLQLKTLQNLGWKTTLYKKNDTRETGPLQE